MLFSTWVFLLAFLPATWIAWRIAYRYGGLRLSLAVITFASFFFYAWGSPIHVILLGCSIGFNFIAGKSLTRTPRRRILALGIALNLAVLGYFKYSTFFAGTALQALNIDWGLPDVLLPIGISFYTFTQLAYLVDAYRGKANEYDFLRYCLFVTFFPHLIAGPIIHHAEVMPQFTRPRQMSRVAHNLSIGMTVFVIGLAKKVIIADSLSHAASPVFHAASTGFALSFFEAWQGALAYTFQLYFDFSGYSDMAIGLAFMFGIRLPINFMTPYQSRSIIEFWRRWHMTLSRFLRDYVYIPLGGNRKGPFRKYINVLVVMLVGGLWHGAGWTFVAWGAFHGLFLVVNQLWTAHRPARFAMPPLAAWAMTFLVIVTGWVFFRAPDFGTASSMLQGMAGLNGIVVPERFGALLSIPGVQGGEAPYLHGRHVLFITGAAVFAILVPSLYTLFGSASPGLGHTPTTERGLWRVFRWRPSLLWAAAICIIMFEIVRQMLSREEAVAFLYFQF